MKTVICVCGGRDFVPMSEHNTWLNELHARYTFTHVIHGAANGADAFAEEWADWNGVPYTRFPANWEAYYLAAGPLRNLQMALHLKKCRENGASVYVLAFPGNKGTASMIEAATGFGIKVIKYENVG